MPDDIAISDRRVRIEARLVRARSKRTRLGELLIAVEQEIGQLESDLSGEVAREEGGTAEA